MVLWGYFLDFVCCSHSLFFPSSSFGVQLGFSRVFVGFCCFCFSLFV